MSAILVLQILASMDVTVCVIQYYTDQWAAHYSRQYQSPDRAPSLVVLNLDFWSLCVSKSGGLRYACRVSGRDIRCFYKRLPCHACLVSSILKTQFDAEATYKLCQFLSEGALIKAMIVLMISPEVSSVLLIVYKDF